MYDGRIKIFSTVDGRLIKQYAPANKIQWLLDDNLGNIIIVNNGREMQQFDTENQSWKNLALLKYKTLYGIAFNSLNECILLTDEGIVKEGVNRKVYLPAYEFYNSEAGMRGAAGWETDEKMQFYMDSRDNLWVTTSHGEWGDDLFIFNTIANKFIKCEYPLTSPSLELNGHLYALYGSMFDYVVVQYTQIQNDSSTSFKGKLVYELSKDPGFNSKGKKLSDGWISKCIFNKTDSKLYLLTSNGLFKAKPDKELSLLKYWTKVETFYPTPKQLKGSFGYLDGKKYSTDPKDEYLTMDDDKVPGRVKKWKTSSKDDYEGFNFVIKMQFAANGKLVLLSGYSGVGLFDGKQFKLLR
ncbi:hypothetical protein GCM10023149_13030 [Mucilaginibacter gynuensis]|uniref:Uncharacterized protein n=1 Tax=Mucilaginibacter gynuensis TaxID=1302236 RepID=A0ABP8G2U7_9SPHI